MSMDGAVMGSWIHEFGLVQVTTESPMESSSAGRTAERGRRGRGDRAGARFRLAFVMVVSSGSFLEEVSPTTAYQPDG